MAITNYHRAIFDYLETYRREHPEAGLTYSLRKRNNAGRPRNLYLFSGSETYILVGLYVPSNGNTKTRSIGFLCDYDPVNDTIKRCKLSIVHDDPKFHSQEVIYQQIIQQIGSEEFEEFSPKRYELTYTDPDWQKNLETYLEQHKPIIDEVIRKAGATETFFVRPEDMEADIKAISQPVEPGISTEKYTWIPFYRELCASLLQHSSEDLIQITKLMLEAQELDGLIDRDADGNRLDLTVIDPYTVLSFTRLAEEDKRLAVSAVLKEWLDISAPLPTDFAGLYTDKNQWIWAFGYSYERDPDDPDKLRELYQQVEQDAVSEDLFNQVLAIKKLSRAKLTESLFSQWPDRYLPVNSKTKLWLRKRNLPAQFTSYSEYHQLLKAVHQHDPRPFYEISEEAYQESIALEPAGETDRTGYWVFQGNPAQFRIVDSLKDGALQTWRVAAHAQRIKPGDKVILWVAGGQPGCYALAQVDSELYTGLDDEAEQSYRTDKSDKEPTRRVRMKVLLNLWDRPVTKADMQGLPVFEGFKGGNQGTNFRATREQYEAILNMRPPAKRQYFKYSPGSQAARWPDDLRDRTMSISFSSYNTGPLDQYSTQTDLDTYLGKVNGNSNETWNMILFKDAAIGDVIFANRGLNTVVGIGIINGPYHYQDGVPTYQHFRAVNWLADQSWQYTAGQFSGNQNLFRPDTFSPTRVGPQIIQEYVKQYPQYRPVFEEHGLLEPDHLQEEPLMIDRYAKNIILYGPPGTGKTYETIDLAVDIALGRRDPVHKVNKDHFDQLRKEGQIEFITFHQNYSYEDFVMGLKPDVDGEDLKFQRSYGIFYRMSKRAQENYEASRAGAGVPTTRPFQEVFEAFMKPLVEEGKEITVEMASGIKFALYDLSERSISFRKPNGSTIHTLSIATLKRIYEGSQEISPNGLKPYYRPLSDKLARLGRQTKQKVGLKNYVLIIDEINRANMSRVFGELITLLEDDKRLGAENALTVTLSSGELFSVPPNLYLIGTMNTADKSLALLDVALRRRFEFVGKYPDYTAVEGLAKDVLERLNKAILAHHKPADFLIGHAYFMGKQPGQLPGVFNNRVIPLLMEYFNGRTDLVKTLLNDAGIDSERHPLTDQLTVNDVG